MEKCVQCNLKAGDCYKSNRSYYSAAKAYEAAAMLMGKELQDWNNAVTYFQKACHMFREHGTPDTAALCLDRGAKMLESVDPEQAAHFYATAADVSMIESKAHAAAEYYGKAARVQLKLRNLSKAAEMMRSQLSHMIESEDMGGSGRAVVCLVIVCLAMDDYVSGRKAFVENRVYVEQHELYTMELLLEGFDTNDPKKIASALKHPFLKSLDNEITKLIRTMSAKYGGKQLEDNYDDYEKEPVTTAPDGQFIDEDAAALM